MPQTQAGVVGIAKQTVLNARDRRCYFICMDWHEFGDDAPKVLTGISPECAAGECSKCPGVGKHEGDLIFCAHDCHRVDLAERVAQEGKTREYPILVGHCDYGDPECHGIIMPVNRGVETDLKCNECGLVFSTLPNADAGPTLLRMAKQGGFCSDICPHCGGRNTSPGFSSMEAYMCRHCGRGVLVQRSVQ